MPDLIKSKDRQESYNYIPTETPVNAPKIRITSTIIDTDEEREPIDYSKNGWVLNEYRVEGINPKNNKIKFKTVVLLNSTNEEEIRLKSNLIDITNIEPIIYEPNERQIKYAKDLDIEISEDMNRRDISCLISRVTGEDYFTQTPLEVAQLLAERNLHSSSYASIRENYNILYHSFSETERYIFFAYSVYQELYGFECYDYTKHSKYDLFCEFAREFCDKERFVESFNNCYCGSKLIPKAKIKGKNSVAYKLCKEFLDGCKTDMDNKSIDSNLITCNHCGEFVNRHVVYCPICHKMILQPIKCERCGTENNVNNIYCDKCHHQLQPDPDVENKEIETKTNLKTGIIVFAILVLLIIIISVACSHGHTADVGVSKPTMEETMQKAIEKNGITETDIEEYFDENLQNSKTNYSIVFSSYACLINCFLDEDLQEWKSNYSQFAEDAIKVTKEFSEKYDFTDIDLTLFFYSDEYMTIEWETKDFGKTGTFTEKTNDGKYENVQNYSLNDLKEFYSRYN